MIKTRKNWNLGLLIAFGVLLNCVSPAAFCADYYVSPGGNDANDGSSPKAPWKSLAKVNRTEFKPGDRILFECGGIWRNTEQSAQSWAGALIPASGEPGNPVTYSAYGTGEKPTLYGSVSASDETDWGETAPHIWGTRCASRTDGPQIAMNLTRWYIHREAGASGTFKFSGTHIQRAKSPPLALDVR